MPQKNSSRRLITPLLLFTLAGWALWALGRNTSSTAAGTAEDGREEPRVEPEAVPARVRATWSKRRLATSLAFVTLFFGGAAFSAGAGDVVANALEGETTTEMTSTEEEPAAEEPAEGEEAPAEEPAEEEPAPAEEEEASEEPASEEPASEEPAPAEDGEPAQGEEPAEDGEPAEEPAGNGNGGGGGSSEPDQDSPPTGADEGNEPAAPANDEGSVLDGAPSGPSQLDPEADAEGFFATIWLHRTMPDPTPPARRLKPTFAKALAAEARRARVDWALVLGVLRARGFDGGAMNTTAVRRVAKRLADLGARKSEWRALLAYRGKTSFADRSMALTRYNRAVGLNALVTGLQAAKPSLQRRVLSDRRLNVYAGGRLDVGMGRTDVRVLVLMRYLAEAHGQVTVSSLTTGHRIYSRPGVVSAHTYGLAVDVAGLGGRSITGNQEPGGLTERGVRNVLLLPRELQPKQVITLLGLGGPSFPMANHHDHMHVGF
jgi:outer membrane biosynthesis protein TonB